MKKLAILGGLLLALWAGLAQAIAGPMGGGGGTPVYLPVLLKIATPTPTATPVATATPTVTPTSLPVGMSVLSNHSSFVDSIDYLHIVGEVLNNTGGQAEFVKVTANIYDGAQLVDTAFTYTTLGIVPAGDKTCFEILLPQPAAWTAYTFESPTYSSTSDPLPALAVLNLSGSIDPTFGWYEILGEVLNDGSTTVEFVQPVGTLYNSAGTVLDCGFTFVNSTDLDPGQTSSFEITYVGRNTYTDVASYRVQVDGNPQ